jgi:hypothetical protein
MKTDPPAMTAISNVSDIEPITNEDRESEENERVSNAK